jgi:hypothetical protein
VAAVVYPRMPICRVGMGPDWVFRWQIAALLGLAGSERGWDGTAKRDAFVSLLGGAIDWPLAAAVRVVAEIAVQEPDTTADIRSLLIDLGAALKRPPNSAITETVLIALELIPYVGDELKDSLRAQLTRDDEVIEEPKQKRPWWQFWKR